MVYLIIITLGGKMKKNIFLRILLVVFICSYLALAHADIVSIDKILSQFSNPKLTSLQKLDLVESYRGTDVRGKAKVTDVVKSYGNDNEAMIYTTRTVRGQKYEIVVAVPKESVNKIRKGNTIKFEGVFTGMSFRTIKLDGGEIIKSAWWWPF